MDLNEIKTVKNGIILDFKGETYVFQSASDLWDFIQDKYQESTRKSIILSGAGIRLENSINHIKAVRELTGLGLKDAKDMVDKARIEGEAVLYPNVECPDFYPDAEETKTRLEKWTKFQTPTGGYLPLTTLFTR